MCKEYPWYDVVNGDEELLQGDFIRECPILIPPGEMPEVGAQIDVEVMAYNVVVMSQSSDLKQRKIDLVLVCPVWPLGAFGEAKEFYRGKEGKEQLRKGHAVGYHLLDKCQVDGFETDFQVVDFRSVFSIPIDPILELTKKSEKRLRLLPPYREHLSQAFARFFMRVGLPVDIRPFK